MFSLLTGLVIIALLSNINTVMYIKKGREEPLGSGYITEHLAICFMLGLVYTVIHCIFLGGVEVPSESNTTSFEAPRATFAVFIFFGAIIWLLNTMLVSVVLNTILNGYTDYKKGCSRLGLDLKDHVGKYFILTSEAYHQDKREDGLYNNCNVKLYKVLPTYTSIGNLPKLTNVSLLATIPEIHVNKARITEYVKAYFNKRTQFRIEGNGEAIDIKDKEMEVIIIGEK